MYGQVDISGLLLFFKFATLLSNCKFTTQGVEKMYTCADVPVGMRQFFETGVPTLTIIDRNTNKKEDYLYYFFITKTKNLGEEITIRPIDGRLKQREISIIASQKVVVGLERAEKTFSITFHNDYDYLRQQGMKIFLEHSGQKICLEMPDCSYLADDEAYKQSYLTNLVGFQSLLTNIRAAKNEGNSESTQVVTSEELTDNVFANFCRKQPESNAKKGETAPPLKSEQKATAREQTSKKRKCVII